MRHCLSVVMLLAGACGPEATAERQDVFADDRVVPSEALAPRTLGVDRPLVASAVSDEISATELSKFAGRRAHDPGVRQYCQALVREHAIMQQDLVRLAQRRGSTFPNTMSFKGKRQLDTLFHHDGPPFDRAFLAMQVDMQQETRTQLHRMAHDAQDPEVRAWAGKAANTWQRDELWARHIHENLFSHRQTDDHSDDPFASR